MAADVFKTIKRVWESHRPAPHDPNCRSCDGRGIFYLGSGVYQVQVKCDCVDPNYQKAIR